MVRCLRINVDKNLIVHYFNNGFGQYTGNVVIYRSFSLESTLKQLEQSGNLNGEKVLEMVNKHLNYLYTDVHSVCSVQNNQPSEVQLTRQPAIHSALIAFPLETVLTISDGPYRESSTINVDPYQLVVLENCFCHEVKYRFKPEGQAFHLTYHRKPLIKLRQKLK